MGPDDMKNSTAPASSAAQDMPFIVLHHTGHPSEPDHYDVLLDMPGHELLLAWRIAAAPGTWPTSGAPGACRLADHRRIYLTYQGSISDNRGQVKRVLAGTARIVEKSATTLQLQLLAQTFECPITLPL